MRSRLLEGITRVASIGLVRVADPGERRRFSGSGDARCTGDHGKLRHRGGTLQETEGETGLDQLGMKSSVCVSKERKATQSMNSLV